MTDVCWVCGRPESPFSPSVVELIDRFEADCLVWVGQDHYVRLSQRLHALIATVRAERDQGEPITIRRDPDARGQDGIDEIVATGHVHLERMSTGQWCLIIDTGRERMGVTILAANGKSAVIASETWRESHRQPEREP